MSRPKPLLIAIVGPNASGKTSLSIKLAKKFNGEIISADSRQVYKGMDIGTGKATKQEQKQTKHHLIDVVPPTKEFNVSHFKKQALKAINKIHQKNKLPFLVGGTGFWIQAIIDNVDLPAVKPNKLLRRKLEKKPITQLFKLLKKLDPKRAKIIDRDNPYRLIRAIEIIKATKQPVPSLKKDPLFNVIIIGVTHPQRKLHQLITQRLQKRFKQGMVAEIKKLHKQGVSWQRLYDFGLEYRYISLFLQGKLNRQEMEKQLSYAVKHYAKRQMTWFSAHGGSVSGGKKDRRIHWIKNYKQADKLIKTFKQKIP